MIDNYKKLFSFLKESEIPANLYEKVINRLYYEKKLIAIRRKIFLYSSATVFSLAALVGAFYYVRLEMDSSGFFNYSSLMFTDFDIILKSWQNFSITLLETLPTTSIILTLISVAILLNMAKNLAKNIQLLNKTSI
jgi:hypothetical protein